MQLRLTPAVKVLLIACFTLFVVQHTVDQFFGGNLLSWLSFSPAGFVLEHRLWQIFTYSFLHNDVMHLFLNLLMLAFMGGEIESHWGTGRFVRFYFYCATAAALSYLGVELLMSGGVSPAPMVGASGAIYGLLMAYGLIFGERPLLFMMVFPMKARHFVWVLVALEMMTTVFTPRGGIANAAHLGGLLAGFILLRIPALLPSQGFRKPGFMQKAKARSNHLKLVIDNQKKARHREDDEKPHTFH